MSRAALRIGLLTEPFFVLSSSSCGPSDEEIATTALAGLLVAYVIALVLLALLAWLWRRTSEKVDVQWGWQLGTALVLGVLVSASTFAFDVDMDLFGMVVLMMAPLVATLLCGSARLALARDSKRLMCCAPIFAAAVVAIPNLLIFVVSPAAANRIIDVEAFLLFWAGGWPWRLALLALLVEALVVGREPEAPAQS